MTDSLDTSDRESEDPREPIRLPVREMRDEPAPQRAAQEGDLPPLPEKRTIRGNSPKGYAPRDMQAYARTAIAAAGGGVPQRESLVAAFLSAMEWGRDHWVSFSMRGQDQREIAEQFADNALASSPQPEAAPAVAQVPQPAEQVEFLDVQNHQMRRAIHAAMSRLSALLDEDQFAEMEQIFTRAGVAATEAPAQANNLTAELQQRCSDWGVYWRAPDAHGVILTVDQATELLRDALGVEVEVKTPAQAAQSAGEMERVLRSFEITGPDADGLLWLVLHGSGTTGKAMFQLGLPDRLAGQVAMMLEQDRRAALSHKEPQR